MVDWYSWIESLYIPTGCVFFISAIKYRNQRAPTIDWSKLSMSKAPCRTGVPRLNGSFDGQLRYWAVAYLSQWVRLKLNYFNFGEWTIRNCDINQRCDIIIKMHKLTTHFLSLVRPGNNSINFITLGHNRW